jgi:DNA-binding response OmpR family regulator
MAKAIPCIMVVEDDRAVRDLVVAFLRKGGHEKIITAGNAEEALFYVFKDPGLDIRLALVDLVLPNASGLALIRKIRGAKSPRRRAIPVVVLTSRTDTDTYKVAARRGIQGYLMKPVSAALLLKTVADVMAGRKPSLSTETQENQGLTAPSPDSPDGP